MEAKAKLFGHSVHQMLIVFPLGLLGMSVVFDIVHLVTAGPIFAAVAYWMMIAGLAGGVLAAPFGLIDWMSIPAGTRAKAVGAAHGIGNVIVLVAFLFSVLLRKDATTAPTVGAYVCSFVGVLLALFTAWLGGELVARHAIGVHDGAGVDAQPLRHAHR
jgi:uncharacterized membrane protein